MNLFEKMRNIEKRQEFLAYRAKRRMPEDRFERMKAYILSSRFEEDVRSIQNGIYSISIPEKKRIPKSFANRKRTVYRFTEDEMSLFRMMAYVLHDYEYLVAKEVYSFKKDCSAKDLILHLCHRRQLHSMYVVKADIVSYGNSIDPDRLIPMIHAGFQETEPEADAFFTWLLSRRQFLFEGKRTAGDTAALPGCPIHNFFTNLYLSDMDQLFVPRCEDYARYSDDIILFQKTKEEAEANMSLLLGELASHGLQPHEDEKTGIIPPGEPYDFLGFTFCGNEVDISAASLKKLKRKMRIRARRLGLDKAQRYHSPEEKATAFILRNRKTFYGREGTNDLCWMRWAFPVITKTDGLHELDLYQQRCIRFLLSGKWSDTQYRVPYQKLKDLGYESLVRAYYRSAEEKAEVTGSADTQPKTK